MPATETVRLDVEGMTCASCASRIERVLGKQDGVSEAVINYATGDAKVVFDPDLTGIGSLAEAVDKIGYGIRATEEHPAVPDAEVR
ncbi:MAG: cation-translocating P-type ATPase [Acidimicrobiia bacterium]|nr:cation-translocating P-type ATPase [Acidimicrobiia bacterium]